LIYYKLKQVKSFLSYSIDQFSAHYVIAETSASTEF